MVRLINKRRKQQIDADIFLEWLVDYRAYLIEAMYENSDLRIIDTQFKNRFTKRGNKNKFFKRNRMKYYRELALG